MNGLYRLSDLTSSELDGLLGRTHGLRSGAAPTRFPGRALGLVFLNPSLRTQASFQRAAALLGLDLVQLGSGSGMWGIEARDDVVMDGEAAEHVREAARVLGRYVDVLCVRAFARGESLDEDRADRIFHGLRRFAGVPVVNMESAQWHPCQALADLATLEQAKVPAAGRFVLTWAYHPKALPHAVPNSTLQMAARRGMHVTLLRPAGFDLHPEVMTEARTLAVNHGGSLDVTDERSALEGANVIYAKSWRALEGYGDAVADAELRAPHKDWCVDESWFKGAPHARFMHCLPVRRNVVVSDAVLDGPRSLVIDQAENRLHAQTALIEALCSGLVPASVMETPLEVS